MSLLRDRECSIHNAHHRLINNFHLLREVLWSEKISLKEKIRLFSTLTDSLIVDVRIAYPDLSAETRNGVRPVMDSYGACSEQVLQAAIENLNLILEYRRFAAEFRILADHAIDILDRSDLDDSARTKKMKVIADAFGPITKGLGRHEELVRGPYGGYFWGDELKEWVKKISAASDRV